MQFRTPSEVIANLPLVTSQVRIGERLWEVTAVQNQDALVDAIDDLEHLPYGFLLWESAVGLARHLCANPGLVEGKRVLELGCGVGIPGIVAAALGAEVYQTDHQQGVLTLARQNAARNGVTGIVQFLADWREWNHTAKYQVLLGADILYERAMHFYLEEIFRRSLAHDGCLLISDPVRPQAMEFLEHLERVGWKMELNTTRVQIDEEAADSKPVEVAVIIGIRG